jgi:serine/threonine-protein kinase
MVFGTPEYMSPEQARGEKPDTRVDVYALGCILFEMVTGDVPFRADNFMGVLTKHLFDAQPLVADRTQRTDLPPGVQDVITQALAKDKSQRFGSMNELAVAVDTLDNAEGVAFHSGAEKARRVATERGREILEGRREAAHASTTPAPGDDIATARRPMLEPALEDDAGIPRPRRGRWAVIGAVVALVLAASGLVVWQLAGDAGPATPEPSRPQAGGTVATPAPAPVPPAPPAGLVPPVPPPASDVAPAPSPGPEPAATPTADPAPAAPKAEAEPPRAADTAKKAVKRPVLRHVVPPLVRPPPSPGAAPPPPAFEPPPPRPPEPKSDLKDPFGGNR